MHEKQGSNYGKVYKWRGAAHNFIYWCVILAIAVSGLYVAYLIVTKTDVDKVIGRHQVQAK